MAVQIIKGAKLPAKPETSVEFRFEGVECHVSRFRPAKDANQSPIVGLVLPGPEGVIYADLFLNGISNEKAVELLPAGTSFVGSFEVSTATPALKDGIPLTTKEGAPVVNRTARMIAPPVNVVRPPSISKMLDDSRKP